MGESECLIWPRKSYLAFEIGAIAEDVRTDVNVPLQ